MKKALGLKSVVICSFLLMLLARHVFLQPDSPQTQYGIEYHHDNMTVVYVKTDIPESRYFISKLSRSPNGRDTIFPSDVTLIECEDDEALCAVMRYEGQSMDFAIYEPETDSDEVTCYETTWLSNNDELTPVDCFPMTEGYWFGGAEMSYQIWPINSWTQPMTPYLSHDNYNLPQSFGPVIERYWLSSNGFAIFVDPDVPLHVSIEEGHICLKGSSTDGYKSQRGNWLKYTTCFSRQVQTTHEYMLETFLKRPSDLPDLQMMKSPIWSTWAQYKQEINQSVVLEYARQILEHNFSHSQLEIDDGYEVAYGDHTFDERKFPNAREMSRTLRELGFRVTLWVTPFVNPDSENYQVGEEHGFFIRNGVEGKAGITTWWNGKGSAIDFTNPAACDWFVDHLEDTKDEYLVDSFKFDAGEIGFVVSIPEYETKAQMENPSFYTKDYAECVARLGTHIEVRASWNNQNLPIFVRMMDKDSNWSRAKGLKTLIPTALTFSLLGYPYVLPDMIGGNGYSEGVFLNTQLPERELFIRWLEITAFLPAMQFSFTPWQYDDVTVELARKYVTFHEDVIFPVLKRASEDYVDGESSLGPVRPIWWVTRDDVTAFRIDDEFMVGDVYLVAPVVENATRWRDVYLPGPMFRDGSRKIVWEDQLRGGDPIPGGTLLRDYRVELEEVSWWKLKLVS